MEEVKEIACHPFTLPVLGEVLVDVEIDGTIVIEVTRGPFSDFAVSGLTDAQLRCDLTIGDAGHGSISAQECTHFHIEIV